MFFFYRKRLDNKMNIVDHCSFSFSNKLARLLWGAVYLFLFRPTLRPMHKWRAFLLRCFGAKLGKNCRIYHSVRIWAPWNLICQDFVVVGPRAEIYNPSIVSLGNYVTVSQGSYICGANHDYNDPAFTLVSEPISIEDFAWITAKAVVLQGLTVGEGAVLAIGSVATKDLTPWTVYGGIPARPIKKRKNFNLHN